MYALSLSRNGRSSKLLWKKLVDLLNYKSRLRLHWTRRINCFPHSCSIRTAEHKTLINKKQKHVLMSDDIFLRMSTTKQFACSFWSRFLSFLPSPPPSKPAAFIQTFNETQHYYSIRVEVITIPFSLIHNEVFDILASGSTEVLFLLVFSHTILL